MLDQYIIQKPELIVKPDHFVTEVVGRCRHHQGFELLVEHQRNFFARDGLLRIVVAGEHRETHGQGDDVDHDGCSSEGSMSRKKREKNVSVTVVRARQVSRWINMVCPSGTGF